MTAVTPLRGHLHRRSRRRRMISSSGAHSKNHTTLASVCHRRYLGGCLGKVRLVALWDFAVIPN